MGLRERMKDRRRARVHGCVHYGYLRLRYFGCDGGLGASFADKNKCKSGTSGGTDDEGNYA